MYVYYSPGTCKYLENWNSYKHDDPSKQFPLEGTFLFSLREVAVPFIIFLLISFKV